MKKLVLFVLFSVAVFARAEDTLLETPSAPVDEAAKADDAYENNEAASREPAAVAKPAAPVAKRGNYPGAADEDDLQVQTRLPDAGLRIDARSVQREVYKTIYNQDLKDDQRESVEE